MHLKTRRLAMLVLAALSLVGATPARAQAPEHSVARRWNDMLLASIRRDFGRPTVHARNLFHMSVAMWDAWAAFDDRAHPWVFTERHQAADREAALKEGDLTAFAEAGADVLYAPGLPDMDAIRAVVKAVAPRPVNVLLGPWGRFGALSDLAEAGVKRVSLGSALFANTLGHLERTAARIAGGDLAAAVEGNTRVRFDAEFG